QGKGVWAREATDGLGVTDEDGVVKLAFDDVAELAQAAYVSDKTVDADDKPIFEAWVGVFDQGDDVALDMNVGLASASHATDFDAITAFAAIHLDGNSLRIRPQSDDDATDVAPFDSTIDAVLGTYFFLQIDARNKDDVKFYINGVLVANQNPFVLTNYAGGLAAIAHIEKGNNDTAADVRLHGLKVRTGLS
ncbi:MAG: hypothetical protein MI923_20360, partial [Phycisphaerales bacterium]|nr:hypothetical protein [Phycisphaerales bacterium]